MAKYKALIIAGGALFALARSAAAADLLPPPPALEPPPVVDFGGWYLRGDVGLAMNANTPSLAISPNPLAGLPAGSTNDFYNPTISDSGFFDFGFGYQFNSWFHADVTEELRGGGSFQALEVVDDTTTPQQYADFYRANLWSSITMLNGYVDLGNWSGITPYVGGGVGFAYNKLFGLTDTGTAYGPGTAGLIVPVGGYFDDAGKWNFAWSLMAGLSFDVTQNLKLDLGYRYLDYGKYTTGTSHCLAATTAGFTCGGGNYTIYSKNELASNDFRIGLRWMIGENTPAPVAPLVRKY
jgi:opacity protein-like surface antigen